MYNEEYAAMLGKRHPSVLDQGSTRAWPELRGSFDQHFGRGKEIGELLKGDDTFYITERNGYSEGLWASWAILPVAAEDGGIRFYSSVFETTKQVLAERHMSTLVLLGRHISAAAFQYQRWVSDVPLQPGWLSFVSAMCSLHATTV
jgi:hypothetical protein